MNDLQTSITKAFEYLSTQSIEIPPDLMIQARLKGVKAGYSSGGIADINARYHDEITNALVNYFSGGNVTSSKNQFRQAMVEAFNSAFDTGWIDGGQAFPVSADAVDWLMARESQEVGHIDTLFSQAKELRKEKEFDYFTWVTARADGYTSTVISIYNAAKLWAKGNQMLTWQLGNTEKHCPTCSKLNGGRHRASWYIGHDYIPRKPGASMECGGYNCDCSLVDDNGNEVTI